MANQEPLVSICIPTFNHASLIHRALLSSSHQTYRNIEIIVVDNTSSDSTKDVVLEYTKLDPRIKYFRNDVNIGSGKNFLKCFEYASGDFVQVLGDDDWISKNCVETGVRLILKNPAAAAILPDVISLKFESNENFSFLDRWEALSGIYSANWFFKKLARGAMGGVGFISFMRRNDVIRGLNLVLANPAHMVQRGERTEPFDMPIFMEVLRHYTYFIVDKNIAYIKTLHSKDHVGLWGDFESFEGMVRYAALTRKSFEAFFKENKLDDYFNDLRIWSGRSIFARSLLAIAKKGTKVQKQMYRKAVNDFFSDYSKKEKLAIVISTPRHFILKISNRIKNFFFGKKKFIFDENYFLTKELVFKVD